jgi:hypothetical protein
MYYSTFMQRYLPYHRLLSRKRYHTDIYDGKEYREIENNLRGHFGYPRIGQKWISETMLYKIVDTLFSNTEVVHHYRGKELEGLELDIWIPTKKLGIEYQGAQHYKVIKHWGGEEGLRKRIESDKRKRKICQKVGYHLVEFNYDEELTEKTIRRKLLRFLI